MSGSSENGCENRPGSAAAETPEGPRILSCGDDDPGSKPAHQRPELPDFWDHRFNAKTTPWDAGRVPDHLIRFVHDHPQPRATLIPGCGSAYEAEFLDGVGWPVTALDFSAAAIDTARARLSGFGGQLLQADFFSFGNERPFDLIYERAFLCALPRKLWPAYAPRCADLLVPGGLLAGFFFLGDAPKGPPFAIDPKQLDELLGPWFERIDDAPVVDSIPVFSGQERWQIWRRRLPAA